MEIGKTLVYIDKLSERLPLFSTVTSLVDLFQKYAIIPFMKQESVEHNHYYNYLSQKNPVRCVVLLIPVIGNILVGIFDFVNRYSHEEPRGEEGVEEDTNEANYHTQQEDFIQFIISKKDAVRDLKLGWTTLMLAVRYDQNYIQPLIDAGEDVNYATDRGWTALMIATEYNPDLVPFLIEKGADVNHVAKDESIASRIAAQSKSRKDGSTALMIAAQYNPCCAKPLIEEGSDVNHAREDGETALTLATAYNPDLVPFLIKEGADVNHATGRGRTALMIAAEHNPDLVPFLIEKGADVNHISESGLTTLMIAAQYNPCCVTPLIKKGADVNHISKNGSTALTLATAYNPDLVPFLIKEGADVNHATGRGRTALMIAAEHNPDLVPFLIKKGADVNRAREDGETALTLATDYNPDLVPFLIKKGADVNHAREDGLGVLPLIEKNRPDLIEGSFIDTIFSRYQSILLADFYQYTDEKRSVLNRVEIYGYKEESEGEWRCRVEIKNLSNYKVDITKRSLKEVCERFGVSDINKERKWLGWEGDSSSDNDQILAIKKILYLSFIPFIFETETLSKVWVQDVLDRICTQHRQFITIKALAQKQINQHKKLQERFNELTTSDLGYHTSIAAYFLRIASNIDGFISSGSKSIRNESIINAIQAMKSSN